MPEPSPFNLNIPPPPNWFDGPISSTIFQGAKPEKPDSNFLTQLVRDAFGTPPPPKQDPKFITSFLNSNQLVLKNPPFKFRDPKLLVGVEVEIENVSYINPNILLCFWRMENDGSLRNHGKEFKTFAIPLQYVQVALEQLFNGLNPDIDFSIRTSIHAHIDVRGLTVEQVLTFLFVYTVMENLLFKFAESNRRNNIFCTPITETRLFNDLHLRSKRDLLNIFGHVWQKYSALNLLPIRDFGTIEFRHMPGTSNVPKLCIWLELLSRMKIYAYQYSLANALTTISDLNTSSQYRKFVESVFGDLVEFLDMTSLLNDMEKAVYICKNCTGTNKFHQQVLGATDKTSALAVKYKIVPEDITDIERVLGRERYIYFMTLHASNNPTSRLLDYYRYVCQHSIAYARAYPGYLELFNYMVDHQL